MKVLKLFIYLGAKNWNVSKNNKLTVVAIKNQLKA